MESPKCVPAISVNKPKRLCRFVKNICLFIFLVVVSKSLKCHDIPLSFCVQALHSYAHLSCTCVTKKTQRRTSCGGGGDSGARRRQHTSHIRVNRRLKHAIDIEREKNICFELAVVLNWRFGRLLNCHPPTNEMIIILLQFHGRTLFFAILSSCVNVCKIHFRLSTENRHRLPSCSLVTQRFVHLQSSVR